MIISLGLSVIEVVAERYLHLKTLWIILRIVIGLYSKVLCCSLDISKAFNRIYHFALLRSMYNKGIPTNIIKIFANWWCKFNGTVLWKEKLLSAPFPIGSGILQGCLLDDNFFNLMMNSVMLLLHKC